MLLLIFSVLCVSAGEGSTNASSPLLPPHPEIPPSYWEQNGTFILVAAGFVLLMLVAVVLFLTRKRPADVPPAGTVAMRELDSLGSIPEDGRVVSEVSRVLKRYFIAAFELPVGELTTAEFNSVMGQCDRIGSELSGTVGQFLRDCDQYKFASVSGGSPGAAARAKQFVVEAEARRRREMKAPAATEFDRSSQSA